MKIAVVADEAARQEWLLQGLQEGNEVVWLEAPAETGGTHAYIDLLFDGTTARTRLWEHAVEIPVLINDVLRAAEQLPQNFVRINGWPTFLGRAVTEAAVAGEAWKEQAAAVLAVFNRGVEWVPDITGFVAPRVVSMIINEAWYALEENVTSKEETDIAMKLGTNYPYGPFEWGGKIGLHHIYTLLEKLSEEQTRYTPCALLKKQVTGE